MDRDPSAQALMAELNGLGRQAETEPEPNLLEGITYDTGADTDEKIEIALNNLQQGLRQANMQESPIVIEGDEFDPIEEARLKTFREKDFEIKRDEDLNELMYYFRECVRGIASELRTERRIEHADLISQVIELKSQIESQAGIVAGIKQDLDDAMSVHRAQLLKMLGSALLQSEKQVNKIIEAGIKGADDGFKGNLRKLVNEEVRVGVGKAFEKETELMTEARSDWAGRLNTAANKTINELEAATLEKTARMAKGWIQNAVDDFMGMSSSTQYIVIGVFATFVVTSILF